MSLIVDIEKNYGSFRLSVSFTAEEGITALLGASGSGKSCTLKCIAGIDRPDRGHIELDGKVLFDSDRKIDLPPQKRKVGYLFQNYALFPNMTVRQNILCGMHALRDTMEKERRLQEVLTLFQLTEQAEQLPSALSGGQQQRTAFARILVSEPDLLLLDEPFSALDSHLRDRLRIEMRDLLRSFGKEVLLVTHSREEAYDMSREIAVMDKGHILTKKGTKALFADPETVPAAILTGCKNIVSAEYRSEHLLYVPDWGVELETAQTIRPELSAIGIRAHYFSPTAPKNSHAVLFVEELEEPFEYTIQFRYRDQKPDSTPVWWRLSKEKRQEVFPEKLGIAPANVLPLY